VGQVFFRVVMYFPVSIIPPMLRTHSLLSTAVIRRASGRRNVSSIIAERCREKYFHGQFSLFCFKGLNYVSELPVT
jgi:hypothetical protein